MAPAGEILISYETYALVKDEVCCDARGHINVKGIHLYTRLHRRPPAEADMQEFFRVSPPSVHQMILTLEQSGFIRRQPSAPRSIEVLVDPKHLPELL